MRSVIAKLPNLAAWLIVLILVLIPFHAFLTIWIGSNPGVYEFSRLWKEALLILLGFGSLFLLWKDKKLLEVVRRSPLFWLIAGYILLHLVLGAWGLAQGRVNGEALAQGLVLNLRFVVFFVICFVIGAQVRWLGERWMIWLLLPASVVVVFGLLQVFVLPYDALKHVGYGPETILPYQTVDQKVEYVRVIATLRGANPLGAYLIIVAAGSAALLLMRQHSRQLTSAGGALLIGSLVLLAFTYSRSAYIGVAIGLGLVGWWLLAQKISKRALGIGVVVLVILGAALFTLFKESSQLKNVVFHTDDSSLAVNTSNEDRLAAQKQGLQEVLHQPFGQGPGTAGPASQHNDGKVRIAENYYLQIGQETGWLGLSLFMLILVFLARALWRLRRSLFGATLLASFFGLAFVNVVSHAWTDDTLSLVWWALAGLAVASIIRPAPKRPHTQV